MKTEKPNILFLMSDEHRADCVGYAGNKVVKTPNLDGLADSGVVFGNAYTPAPACVPARQCMMSGQLPKTCGCEGWIDLKPGYNTFARHFSKHVYTTAAFGKLHHQGIDQMQGWTRRPAGDLHVTYNHIEGVDWDAYKKYYSGGNKWSHTKEVKRAGVGESDWFLEDRRAVNAACEFIEEHFCSPYYDRQNTAPLLLKVSLNLPHYPYLTDKDRFNYYLNRVEPVIAKEASEHSALSTRHRIIPGKDVSEREIRRATAAYYGMVETMDEMLGKVLEKLNSVGENLDDWIIVYCADHGELLGEHQVWEKTKFYDQSVSVPLIIKWSKEIAESGKVSENVSLCDLYATLCELCDLPVPDGLDSRSLIPLMLGKTDDWDNEAISQCDMFEEPHTMIKRDHLKYQHYGTDASEVLFDLKNDPEENINVVNDPDYADAVQQFRKRFKEIK